MLLQIVKNQKRRLRTSRGLMILSMTEKHTCDNTVAMKKSKSLTDELRYLLFSREILGK